MSGPVGNHENKYESANPVSRLLVRNFQRRVTELVKLTGAERAHEIGCGEGYMTRHLAEHISIRGSDHSPEIIEVARSLPMNQPIDFRVRSVYDLEKKQDGEELIICLEVLEHLEDPEAGLARLADITGRWLLVSVPREPLWRILNVARGKYWCDLGNTPGHLNHWSRRAFRRFVGNRISVKEIRSPLPWSILLAEKK